ncbi:MAG: zinc ribbon domain-containing protein [Nanoarchaeota archaeon]
MNKLRCQSCGMPLGFPLPEHFFGTNSNGSVTKEYCQFCFKQGNFTNPTLTVDEMIASSIQHMTSQLEFPKEKATKLAHEIIPQLKRWKNYSK